MIMGNKYWKRPALVLVGIALMAADALGQGTLQGVLTDPDGAGIPFANVFIESLGTGAASDENGTYSLSNVPAGSHTVRFSSLGYLSVEEEAVVQNGGTTILNVELASNEQALGELVVTGVVNPQSSLESSVSISTLTADNITNNSARTTAEIFRSIPGVRAEASAGDGNTNITVRGVPIATGGSKFLLLQEDGLPVLQFGDIAFATADIFVRADQTIGRVEALRGGSASTLASNSPAGLINLISRTGEVEGGSVSASFGLDYNSLRTDFAYGSPLGKGVSFHVGGYFRRGEGPRPTGFISDLGGQLKANLTKRFRNGYSRVYVKYLNEKTPAYMPMPILVSGTNADPTWSSVEGFSATRGTLHSPYIMDNLSINADGTGTRRSNISDGLNPRVFSFGNETQIELADGWSLTNRARMSYISGRFVAPFTAEVGPADNLATSIAGAGYTIGYADGTAFPENANGNGLLMRMHLFDVDLNNFNNFSNDLRLSKSFDRVDVTAGVYNAHQNISMSWLWNSYLTDVTDEGMRPVDLSNADTAYTQNGLLAYGTPFWGNCCQRNYDVQYDIIAPYGAVEVDLTSALNLSASVRYDAGTVTGSYAGGDGQTAAIDMDGDGVINEIEENVATINNAAAKPVNYDYSYLSYSVGLNYLLNDRQSVFGRFSSGGRANADRLLFGPFILDNGEAADGLSSDMVQQAEAGYKFKTSDLTVNATGFFAMVEEQNFEATTQTTVNREYTALGLEVDAVAAFGDFNVLGSFTFTDAEISSDALNAAVVGNTPRRQAALIYNLGADYRYRQHSIGLRAIGTTGSYAQDNNELLMPGYAYLNAFLSVRIAEGMYLGLNANNLLNTIGITESEEGSIVEGQDNYVRARSITGRSTSASLRWTF